VILQRRDCRVPYSRESSDHSGSSCDRAESKCEGSEERCPKEQFYASSTVESSSHSNATSWFDTNFWRPFLLLYLPEPPIESQCHPLPPTLTHVDSCLFAARHGSICSIQLWKQPASPITGLGWCWMPVPVDACGIWVSLWPKSMVLTRAREKREGGEENVTRFKCISFFFIQFSCHLVVYRL